MSKDSEDRFDIIVLAVVFGALGALGAYWAIRGALAGSWEGVLKGLGIAILFFVGFEKRRLLWYPRRAAKKPAAQETPGSPVQGAGFRWGTFIAVLSLVGLVLVTVAMRVWPEEPVRGWDTLMGEVTAIEDELTVNPLQMEVWLRSEVLRPLAAVDDGRVKLGKPTADEVTAAQPALQEARGRIGWYNGHLATLAGLWGEMAELKAGHAQGTWAGQQRRLAELGLQTGVTWDRYFSRLAQVSAGPWPEGMAADAAERELAGFLQQVDVLRARSRELERASRRYRDANF